jgi:alpha-glucosidase
MNKKVKLGIGESWWKNAVIYQIYPLSFKDSNNDGIGDLKGIIQKLDYISWLGVDAIWLSPVYQSPMADWGYDISDYRSIDPFFGNMKDFDDLLKDAHKKNIKLIMDLVINHTSDLHPWFLESRLSKDNPKRDWYIWHQGKNKKPPNNWKSAFGGGAWEWDHKTEEFYLHSFLKEQPDLNWRNPEVKKAVFNEIKFWLDKGVDGFRLDVVNCYFKDKDLRNNPFFLGPTPRPYDLQKHIYDRDRPEMHSLLKELRKLVDSYKNRVLIGEVLVEFPGNQKIAASYLGNGMNELDMSFDFSQVFTRWNANKMLKIIQGWYDVIPKNGWAALAFSSHDQIRTYSRFAKGKDSIKRAKVFAALFMTLKGTPFIYYGEELGMKNGKLKRKDFHDPVGVHYWPLNSGRDGERTPMQWSSKRNAGFSSVKPWIKVNPDYKKINVENSRRDSDSLLNLYKTLIKLRRQYPVLNNGDWVKVDKGPNIIAYYRLNTIQKILIILNFSSRIKSVKIDNEKKWEIILSTYSDRKENILESYIKLNPYEGVILE